jgi:hypothetical protein
VRSALTTAIDRRLERLVVARVRRRAPALGLVPTQWIVVATRPRVRCVRQRVLVRMALATNGAAVALAVVLAA